MILLFEKENPTYHIHSILRKGHFTVTGIVLFHQINFITGKTVVVSKLILENKFNTVILVIIKEINLTAIIFTKGTACS